MCGGSIEMIPCAVSIHLWRDHRYSHDSKGKGGYRWNTDRIAETWLDDNYKKFYYRLVGDTKTRNYGDISDRLELKKKLGCKDFTWFVKNVHPNVQIPREITDEVWLKKEEEEKFKKEKLKQKEEKLKLEENLKVEKEKPQNVTKN